MRRVLNAPTFKDNPNIIRSPSIPKRYPLLSLVDGSGGLYFVNESSEIITSVSTVPWGFSGELSLQGGEEFSYENIQPNEGVLVQKAMTQEEYENNIYYGKDFYKGLYLYVVSNSLGSIRIDPDSKYSVEEQILVYTDFTSPSRVMIKKMDEIENA